MPVDSMRQDLPMNVDPTASLVEVVEVVDAMANGLLLVGPVVQTLMYELIAFGKPL